MVETEHEFGGPAAATRQFETTKREAAALAAELSDEQFNWRQTPGQWSIGQCLMHLANGTDATLPALDRAIAQARERGWAPPTGPVRYGWFTRMMVGSMEPPPRWRMKTNRIFYPPNETLRKDDVLRVLDDSRERVGQRTRQAAQVDFKRAIVVSPVSRLIRVPLGGYLAFLAAHDRRHLHQAREIRAMVRG